MSLTPTTCPCCEQPIYSLTLLPLEAQKKVLGCQGLNPTAFRECVEALTTLRSKYEPTKSSYGFVTKEDLAKVDAALAHAEGRG